MKTYIQQYRAEPPARHDTNSWYHFNSEIWKWVRSGATLTCALCGRTFTATYKHDIPAIGGLVVCANEPTMQDLASPTLCQLFARQRVADALAQLFADQDFALLDFADKELHIPTIVKASQIVRFHVPAGEHAGTITVTLQVKSVMLSRS